MTSSFGWLDTDDEQRRRMIEVVDLFREQGTIDELGIGSIRDTFSNALFPGTSTLHTRLRYALFLPWLMQHAVARKNTAPEMISDFRQLEFRLIDSLLAGGEDEGVMGNVAGAKLKRLPSVAYWSALGRWGLLNAASSDAYFRRQVDYQRLARRAASPDDDEAREILPPGGIDPNLPDAPGSLLKEAQFALTPEDESYLSQRIATTAKGSLFAWLVAHPPGNVAGLSENDGASFPWEIANLGQLPDDLAGLVEHARRFSLMVQGAALVYNTALARHGGYGELVERHQAALLLWQGDQRPADIAASWDQAEFWAAVSEHNARIHPRTRYFIDQWIDLVGTGDDLSKSKVADKLVENRERQIKGGRARFVNQAALDRWSGASGLGRLDFRWGISRSHLLDLYNARKAV